MKTIKKILTIAFALVAQLIFAQDNQTNSNYCHVQSVRGNNYITNVQFSEINNYSELGTNGYSNFTDQKAIVDRGNKLTIKVDTKWNHWSSNSIQVWIDWNADAGFDDSERVFHKTGTGVFYGIVSVPEDAKIGTTRMRVRYNYNIELGPCESKRNERGEIEDYLIEVAHPKRPRAFFDVPSSHIYDDKELVEFKDLSTGNPTSWYWEFEGGIPSISTDQFPLVRYIQSGSYSVKLVVENEYGKDEITYVGYMKVHIQPRVYPPFCNFSTVLTHVTDADQYVRFDDLSENNPTSWYWEFEGATPSTSTEQIPQVKYSESGKYTVKLTVSNPHGQDSKTREGYITVDLGPKELCTSSNQNPIGQHITGVEFENVRSISTYNENGYSWYNFPGTNVERGPIEYPYEASVIHIKTNAAWENTKTGYWVDWNQDGDFDDPGEERLLANHSSKEWVSFFTVPADAKLGQTILRVRTMYDSNLTPCGEGWFGETEDYVINIVDDPRKDGRDGQRGAVAQNVVVSPNPSTDGIFTFTFNETKEYISFKVFNNNGLEVSSSNSQSGTNAILSVPNLKPGLYTAQVTTNNSSDTIRLAIQ
ncbi:GEVED domain-containing protein [Aquimarina sp. 2201CG1-2-11]|uniref:GEVED domain-containing protein n=1 Tax=Aquimarina discodermiae TaxID=3231043 RepID=UPI0034619424